MKKVRQKVFWDVDDVILTTSEAVLEIINKKFNLNKTEENIKDWSFRSLNRELTPKDAEELFDSEEFWKTVKVKEDFFDIIKNKDKKLNIFKAYDNKFLTKGSDINLQRKAEFLREEFNKAGLDDYIFEEFEYIGLTHEQDKSEIDMTGGIQIDDNYSNFSNTNAKIRVLISNGRDTNYNMSYYNHQNKELKGKPFTLIENLYKINDLKEFREILIFNAYND